MRSQATQGAGAYLIPDRAGSDEGPGEELRQQVGRQAGQRVGAGPVGTDGAGGGKCLGDDGGPLLRR